MAVEIHNTDAEGRLALADTLDVAVTQGDPCVVVDVATLTGAIKMALGCGVGGLFGNRENLVREIYRSSLNSGDPMWPMPLIQSERKRLWVHICRYIQLYRWFWGSCHSSSFPRVFCERYSLAHLDIYAWNDRAKGALQEEGGSGQAVQCLAHWLDSLPSSPNSSL